MHACGDISSTRLFQRSMMVESVIILDASFVAVMWKRGERSHLCHCMLLFTVVVTTVRQQQRNEDGGEVTLYEPSYCAVCLTG